MKKWVVVYKTTAYAYVEVEAPSAEDAVDNADRLGVPSLCENESIELDGLWDVEYVEEAD